MVHKQFSAIWNNAIDSLNISGLDLSYVNDSYTPTAGTPYVTIDVSFIAAKSSTIGISPVRRYEGTALLLVHTEKNTGEGESNTIVDTITSNINTGSKLDNTSFSGTPTLYLSVSDILINNPIPDSAWFIKPVEYQWYSHN